MTRKPPTMINLKEKPFMTPQPVQREKPNNAPYESYAYANTSNGTVCPSAPASAPVYTGMAGYFPYTPPSGSSSSSSRNSSPYVPPVQYGGAPPDRQHGGSPQARPRATMTRGCNPPTNPY